MIRGYSSRNLGSAVKSQSSRKPSLAKKIDTSIGQNRHYMTSEEYGQLSTEFRDKYESAGLKSQNGADCYFVSSRNSNLFRKKTGSIVGAIHDYSQLNEDNLSHVDKNLEAGIPGVLYGRNVSTMRSRWINHAVTVLGKDGEDYIVHDPDPSHHQETERAHQAGASEPKDYLRRLSEKELMNAKQHITFSHMEPNYSGVFEQAESKAADSTSSSSSLFGKLFKK